MRFRVSGSGIGVKASRVRAFRVRNVRFKELTWDLLPSITSSPPSTSPEPHALPAPVAAAGFD